MTRILIVEDNDSIRDSILEILEAEGYEAIGTREGKQGYELAQAEIPDLILCDVTMPKLDGYEVLALIRQNPTTTTIPFIFLTAKSAKGDFRLAMELGADDYLTKPFTRAELLGAIDAQLQKKAATHAYYIKEIEIKEEQLNYLMHYDSLTGLPNRLSLQERFDRIGGGQTVDGEESPLIPMLYVSLDRFNQTIEAWGPACGDRLLQAVARRLLQCMGPEELVAYLGTNQFVCIPSGARDRTRAIDLAEAAIDCLRQPFTIDDREVFVTASMGITFYPDNGTELESLLGQAALAMEEAIARGGNQYQFYTPTFKVEASDRLALETSLRYVLERDELQVYYQPRVSLLTGKVVGAEALLRWYHQERGIISPGRFIPIAEETGAIVPIGEWVLQQACRQAKEWHRFGPLLMAINVSGRQFDLPNLPERVFGIVEGEKVEMKSVELELTEGILVKDASLARQKLQDLKALGVQIAIDDFGTGYSSLGYLQQFPFDILKIDRCFVRNLTDEARNAAIVSAIIQMAHNLNLRVIAEGVETESELEFLSQQACDEMQGYLFAKPMSVPDFEKFMEASPILPSIPV